MATTTIERTPERTPKIIDRDLENLQDTIDDLTQRLLAVREKALCRADEYRALAKGYDAEVARVDRLIQRPLSS